MRFLLYNEVITTFPSFHMEPVDYFHPKFPQIRFPNSLAIHHLDFEKAIKSNSEAPYSFYNGNSQMFFFFFFFFFKKILSSSNNISEVTMQTFNDGHTSVKIIFRACKYFPKSTIELV